MSKEILAEVIRTKLELSDALIGLLPAKPAAAARGVRTRLLQAVVGACGEFMKTHGSATQPETGLRNIPVS
jgi:hypothetical protein